MLNINQANIESVKFIIDKLEQQYVELNRLRTLILKLPLSILVAQLEALYEQLGMITWVGRIGSLLGMEPDKGKSFLWLITEKKIILMDSLLTQLGPKIPTEVLFAKPADPLYTGKSIFWFLAHSLAYDKMNTLLDHWLLFKDSCTPTDLFYKPHKTDEYCVFWYLVYAATRQNNRKAQKIVESIVVTQAFCDFLEKNRVEYQISISQLLSSNEWGLALLGLIQDKNQFKRYLELFHRYLTQSTHPEANSNIDAKEWSSLAVALAGVQQDYDNLDLLDLVSKYPSQPKVVGFLLYYQNRFVPFKPDHQDRKQGIANTEYDTSLPTELADIQDANEPEYEVINRI